MYPAEHTGHTRTRLWHKVKWVVNPHPGDEKWKDIVGKVDLLTDDEVKHYQKFVVVLYSVPVETCKSAFTAGYGRLTEEKIDRWMNENTRK